MNRISLAGAGAVFTLVALAAGITVSSVESRHHKDADAKSTPVARSDTQRRAVAEQLIAMQPAGGITPSSRCPQDATVYDACFITAAQIQSVSSPVFAEILGSLGVSVTSKQCSPVKGGANGPGTACLALGTWNGSPVSVFAFSPDADSNDAGFTGTDVMMSAVASLPS